MADVMTDLASKTLLDELNERVSLNRWNIEYVKMY